MPRGFVADLVGLVGRTRSGRFLSAIIVSRREDGRASKIVSDALLLTMKNDAYVRFRGGYADCNWYGTARDYASATYRTRLTNELYN